ncbi:MAG: hypothetical protein K6T29_01885 [Peptococcaceae bacterium]|nr:hypothetical protein [Peptococcaceae bacterium]
MGNNKSTVSGRYIFLVGAGSFLLAVVFTFLSETFASRLNNIILSFVFLVIIILINMLADVVGTAVTAASHITFNARAAKRVRGAPQGLQLIRNADKVANLANDVVGDITTTVGGALGISIVVQIMALGPVISQFWLNVLITAMIAAVIVSTKALAKKIALSHPDEVIFIVGKILARVEDATGYSPFQKRRSSRSRKGG